MKWIIAGIVAYIAFMQFKTNRDRLRLELYKKRFSIYKGLNTIIRSYIRDLDISIAALKEFRAKTHEAAFLFDDDIVQYLEEVYNNALTLNSLNYKNKTNLPDPEGAEIVKKIQETGNWLERQLIDSKPKFSKYLKFKTHIRSFW